MRRELLHTNKKQKQKEKKESFIHSPGAKKRHHHHAYTHERRERGDSGFCRCGISFCTKIDSLKVRHKAALSSREAGGQPKVG
jgi:hypothetical protein